MADDYFLDSTPSAVPLQDDPFNAPHHQDQVEEHVEEVTVEGDDVHVEGDNVVVHEEIIEEPPRVELSLLRYVLMGTTLKRLVLVERTSYLYII